MFSIHLNNLKFFSFHGIHPEEKILGNEFEVNASVSFEGVEQIHSIHQTINYVKIYEVIKRRMDKPTPLLETLVQDITDLIYEEDKRIKSISISIKKSYPPIEAFTGNIGVSYKKDF